MTMSKLSSPNGIRVASPADAVIDAGAWQLAGLGHGRGDGGDLLELGVVRVQRDHLGAPAGGLERVPAGAAAQVEQPRSRLMGSRPKSTVSMA